MKQARNPRRRVAVALIASGAIIAPLTLSAASPTVSVAEMAAAQQPADRTGVISQTVTTTTTTTTTTSTSTTTTSTVPPPPLSSSQALEILALVNQERAEHGLQSLRLETRLNAAAQQHSVEQGLLGDIYHVAPDGTGPGDRIKATGYSFSTWGENVAGGQRSAEAVMEDWMNSPGHCRNILRPSFTEMGVGYAETNSSYRVWWTQAFARPSDVPTPPGVYDPAWC